MITECTDGTYGQNCVKNCSGHCLNGSTCNKQTGHCNGGCDPGYRDGDCSEGKFKENVGKKQNRIDHVNVLLICIQVSLKILLK